MPVLVLVGAKEYKAIQDKVCLGEDSLEHKAIKDKVCLEKDSLLTQEILDWDPAQNSTLEPVQTKQLVLILILQSIS